MIARRMGSGDDDGKAVPARYATSHNHPVIFQGKSGMRKMDTFMLIGLIAQGLMGCGTNPVHEVETFASDPPYQRRIPALLDKACEGARLALLSQGYAVDDSKPRYLKGGKSFQPDEDVHVTLEFQVVCVSTRGGTTLYANAVESRYDLKKSRQAAGINIPTLGSISLPWGSTTESLVKVASETVDDAAFYQRYWQLVEQQLGIATARARD